MPGDGRPRRKRIDRPQRRSDALHGMVFFRRRGGIRAGGRTRSMTIKEIFTIVDLYDEALPAAKLALDVARTTSAHVTGLALAMEPLAPGFIGSPIPADYI